MVCNFYILISYIKKCRVSFSRTGEPGDNAVNESSFSRFKEEWRDVFGEAKTFKELEDYIKKAIDYYNDERYHSSIGMKAPVKFIKKQAEYLMESHSLVVS